MRSLFLISFMVSVIACGREPTSEVSIVYGSNDRTEINEAPEHIQNLGSQVGLLYYRDQLVDIDTEQLKTRYSNHLNKPYCDDIPHRDQFLFGVCTLVMLDNQHGLTAGHCVQSQSDCDNFNVTFDHSLGALETKDGFVHLAKKDQYECKTVVKRSSGELDYALIKLDRDVSFAVQDVKASSRLERRGEQVDVISHPFGLPKKYLPGARVLGERSNHRFLADIDFAVVGSGSPVFSKEDQVFLGIAVRGGRDFVKDETQGCYRETVCADNACEGEQVLRWEVIKKDLSLDSSNQKFDGIGRTRKPGP